MKGGGGMPNNREWLDSGGYFIFGKYGGPNPAPVEDVAKEDPSYLRWILENVEDLDHEDRNVIETALAFRKRK